MTAAILATALVLLLAAIATAQLLEGRLFRTAGSTTARRLLDLLSWALSAALGTVAVLLIVEVLKWH